MKIERNMPFLGNPAARWVAKADDNFWGFGDTFEEAFYDLACRLHRIVLKMMDEVKSGEAQP